MRRPRLSLEHAKALRAAAALSGLTVTLYLERVIRPMVEEDLRERANGSPALAMRGQATPEE
jgi:hypothetical protein